jgi:hypothetical protein
MRAVRIVKATVQEKEAYRLTKALYPMSHWVIANGERFPVEFLNEADGPKYEVIAPKGWHFDEGVKSTCSGSLHTMLAYTLADLKERVECTDLSHCEGPDDIDHSNSVLVYGFTRLARCWSGIYH